MLLGCVALEEHKDSIQIPTSKWKLSVFTSVEVLAVVTIVPLFVSNDSLDNPEIKKIC